METIKGKNILIAGATGSIGSEVAKLLSRSGANLFLAGRNAKKIRDVAEACQVLPAHTFEFDIRDPESVIQLASSVHSHIRSADILINATGIGILKPFESITENEFIQTIQVNLIGSFLLLKAFLPKMKEARQGLVINIPGVLGKAPMTGAAAYSASKYGLVGMMQSIREETKRTDIRITNLFMGGVDSAFWDDIDMRVQREKMISVADAARAVWFLCQQPAGAVVSEMVLQPFNHQVI